MRTQILKAQPRKVLGRKVKQLRRDGVIPANIYGKKVKSEAIQVTLSDFSKVYAKAGETGIVEIAVGGKKHPVLIHNVQTDPVTDIALHADFLQINLKEKVTAQVPIEVSGKAPAEKEGKGIVVRQLDEVEVEALPTELPEKFEVDLTALREVDEAIHVKNIKIDKAKVEIKNDPELIIVKVEPLRKEEEVAPPVEEEAEEAVEEGKEEKEEKEKEVEEKPKAEEKEKEDESKEASAPKKT